MAGIWNDGKPDDALDDGDLSPLNGLNESTWEDDKKQEVMDRWKPGNFNLIDFIIKMLNDWVDGLLVGISGFIGLITATVDNDYVKQLPIVNDHSASITDIHDTIERIILQGDAITFTSDGTYIPGDDVTTVEVILIGAGGSGGGGASRAGDYANCGGYGGAGGGEVHTVIPRSLLGETVSVKCGKARSAGGQDTPGYGGGDTSFGELKAGGGTGGLSYPKDETISGGVGMIPGGDGGRPHLITRAGGAYTGPDRDATVGGSSSSSYSLNNGGGGGGAGATSGSNATHGGAGSVAAGGAAGHNGDDPPDVAAIGGGGGGGAVDGDSSGGAGGYPGGGGGGGGHHNVGVPHFSHGGMGAHGIVFVIEHVA